MRDDTPTTTTMKALRPKSQRRSTGATTRQTTTSSKSKTKELKPAKVTALEKDKFKGMMQVTDPVGCLTAVQVTVEFIMVATKRTFTAFLGKEFTDLQTEGILKRLPEKLRADLQAKYFVLLEAYSDSNGLDWERVLADRNSKFEKMLKVFRTFRMLLVVYKRVVETSQFDDKQPAEYNFKVLWTFVNQQIDGAVPTNRTPRPEHDLVTADEQGNLSGTKLFAVVKGKDGTTSLVGIKASGLKQLSAALLQKTTPLADPNTIGSDRKRREAADKAAAAKAVAAEAAQPAKRPAVERDDGPPTKKAPRRELRGNLRVPSGEADSGTESESIAPDPDVAAGPASTDDGSSAAASDERAASASDEAELEDESGSNADDSSTLALDESAAHDDAELEDASAPASHDPAAGGNPPDDEPRADDMVENQPAEEVSENPALDVDHPASPSDEVGPALTSNNPSSDPEDDRASPPDDSDAKVPAPHNPNARESGDPRTVVARSRRRPTADKPTIISAAAKAPARSTPHPSSDSVRGIEPATSDARADELHVSGRRHQGHPPPPRDVREGPKKRRAREDEVECARRPTHPRRRLAEDSGGKGEAEDRRRDDGIHEEGGDEEERVVVVDPVAEADVPADSWAPGDGRGQRGEGTEMTAGGGGADSDAERADTAAPTASREPTSDILTDKQEGATEVGGSPHRVAPTLDRGDAASGKPCSAKPSVGDLGGDGDAGVNAGGESDDDGGKVSATKRGKDAAVGSSVGVLTDLDESSDANDIEFVASTLLDLLGRLEKVLASSSDVDQVPRDSLGRPSYASLIVNPSSRLETRVLSGERLIGVLSALMDEAGAVFKTWGEAKLAGQAEALQRCLDREQSRATDLTLEQRGQVASSLRTMKLWLGLRIVLMGVGRQAEQSFMKSCKLLQSEEGRCGDDAGRGGASCALGSRAGEEFYHGTRDDDGATKAGEALEEEAPPVHKTDSVVVECAAEDASPPAHVAPVQEGLGKDPGELQVEDFVDMLCPRSEPGVSQAAKTDMVQAIRGVPEATQLVETYMAPAENQPRADGANWPRRAGEPQEPTTRSTSSDQVKTKEARPASHRLGDQLMGVEEAGYDDVYVYGDSDRTERNFRENSPGPPIAAASAGDNEVEMCDDQDVAKEHSSRCDAEVVAAATLLSLPLREDRSISRQPPRSSSSPFSPDPPQRSS